MTKLSYTVEQAGAETGLSAADIRTAIRDGALVAHVSGQGLLILGSDLQRFLTSLPTLHDLSARVQRESIAAEAATRRERGRQIVQQVRNQTVSAERERGRSIGRTAKGEK